MGILDNNDTQKTAVPPYQKKKNSSSLVSVNKDICHVANIDLEMRGWVRGLEIHDARFVIACLNLWG